MISEARWVLVEVRGEFYKHSNTSWYTPAYFLPCVNRGRRLSIGKGGHVMLSGDEEQPTPEPSSDAAKKGRRTTRKKYGDDHYREIGKKGGAALKKKRGSEYYRTIAQKGGQANATKYGPDHFSEMGKKGGNKTKERQDPDFYSRIGKLGGAAKRQKKADS